jgi:hypothetical protein
VNAQDARGLYELLPAAYRARDAALGDPLHALLEVIEAEFRTLQDDIDRLYDNWFVETCDEWVVPYIGDLLGVRQLLPIGDGVFTQRAAVANTIGYRRRKGTAAMLEQLALDVTGWPAKAVEFLQLLAATQFLNHVRPASHGTVDLRRANQLELIDSPFDQATHTAEVRHIDNGRGRYGIANVGLFLWRLQSYPLTTVTARPMSAVPPSGFGYYTFSPLGLDAPLFNLPRTETALTQQAAETNVPGPLRRRALHDELEARRQRQVGESSGFFAPNPVFQVHLDGASEPVPPSKVAICDLSDPPTPLPAGWERPPDGAAVGVDPVLGRLALPGGATGAAVEVSYAYGYPGDLGGGPYDRRQSIEAALPRGGRPDRQMGVSRAETSGGTDLYTTLAAAVDAWNHDPVALGVIAVMDSRSYGSGQDPDKDPVLPEIVIPEGCRLVIVAADWPQDPPDDLGQRSRTPGRLTPSGRRPHLYGPIRVRGTAPAGHLDPGELVLDGLLVGGGLLVAPGNLGSLRVAHTTLVPAAGAVSLTVASGSGPQERNDVLRLVLERCISGPLAVSEDVAAVSITDSIIDAADGHHGHQVAVTAPATDIQSSTVLGEVKARTLDAGNSIFTEPVTVERRQSGCVRFCYLPPGSVAPRRFRCQPASPEAAQRVVPRFASVTYGQPVYGQLSPSCPDEIARGAEDEGEMGAFHFLQQPRRIDNLRASLDEYLRIGLEAGIFLAT